MRARHRHFNPAHAGATLALDARYIAQANASAVSSWASRPRGSFTMAQANAAIQPTLQLTAMNGAAAVRFDGADDVMTCSRIATTSNFTAIIAAKGAGQSNRILFAQRASAVANAGRTNFIATGESSPFQKGRLFFNNGTSYNVISTTDVFDNNATLFCSESDGSGNSHVRVKNGAKEGTLTGQAWTPENNDAAVGAQTNGSNAFSGDIGAVSFFPAQCSDALRCRAHHAAAYSFKISCN
jgi:hypothetical protein